MSLIIEHFTDCLVFDERDEHINSVRPGVDETRKLLLFGVEGLLLLRGEFNVHGVLHTAFY
jgi:hypothetical protein